MEVPNVWCDAGEFIRVVQKFLVAILAHLQSNVIAGELIDDDSLHLVERVLSGLMTKDEGVGIEVGNKGD